ncbi:MAG: toprim domain-containing protein [Nanopusillaceae archaeon]
MKKIVDFLYNIKSRERTLIIVEGRRDKEALNKMGIKNVYTIYELRKMENIFLDYKEAIILTDNDKKGNKLYLYVKNILESEGLTINNYYRKKFFNIFKVKEVEDINKKIDRILFYVNYFENPEKILEI